MSISRKFFHWRRSALAAAAEWLLDEQPAQGPLDLAGYIIALPGSGAGRRLLEILVQEADRRSRPLVPPQIVTAGKLPELLYEARRPFANECTQQLAWIGAMKDVGRRRLSGLSAVVPDDDDLFAWLALGQLLSRLHHELAAAALDFPDVARQGARLEDFDEAGRWELLAEIQQRYLRILDDLDLWDLQTARLVAIQKRECRTKARIVLVGAVDLNRAQRSMLDQVAGQVTALVFAPPELADRFDEHGCLRANTWQDAELDLTTEQIDVVDGPGDQADAVVRAIAAFDGRYSAEEITIGVPDEQLVPAITERFEQHGLRARHGAGIPVSRSSPYRLLVGLADLLDRSRRDAPGTSRTSQNGQALAPRFAAFAALVRHPAIGRWLATQRVAGGYLTELDEYYGTHLPARLDPFSDRSAESGRLGQVQQAIGRLLRGLTGPARRPADWAPAILDVLGQVYGYRKLEIEREADRLVFAGCETIQAALRDSLRTPHSLAPSVTAADCLRLILRELDDETMAPRADAEAIELVGWLELPLDDAPALIVVGLNEGIVPAARNGDLFLPNELRRRLQLEDNAQRYARDAYALSVLAASRQVLRLVAGRRTADNDSLAPSRLLFAAGDETVAERTLKFFSRQKPAPRSRSLKPASTASFEVPRPRPLAVPVTSMRVTEFADYLACPYRYYLRHRLRLDSLDDSATELDPGQFGRLVHEVLSRFGASSSAHSGAAAEIRRQLDHLLDEVAAESFARALPAVAVQIEQARYRLRAFADWQARWRDLGWRIASTEQQVAGESAPLLVDGEPMYLRGRIDRIDVHEVTGQRVVLDYKTADAARTPEQTHHTRQGEFIDLQLPLYRHLAPALGISGPIGLGYILVPKDVRKVGEALAQWTDAELQAADEQAAGVVRQVRRQVFWPPAETPPAFCENLAPICQDGYYGAVLAAAEEAEESPP